MTPIQRLQKFGFYHSFFIYSFLLFYYYLLYYFFLLFHLSLHSIPSDLLGPHSLCVHCVAVSGEDEEILHQTDTLVVHNPSSNMNNAVGFANIGRMMNEKKIIVGLGTDGMSQDMISEYKAGYVGHKLDKKDPQAMGWEMGEMLFKNNSVIASRFFSLHFSSFYISLRILFSLSSYFYISLSLFPFLSSLSHTHLRSFRFPHRPSYTRSCRRCCCDWLYSPHAPHPSELVLALHVRNHSLWYPHYNRRWTCFDARP